MAVHLHVEGEAGPVRGSAVLQQLQQHVARANGGVLGDQPADAQGARGHSAPAFAAVRPATMAQNSPTVIPASCSVSSSANFSPYWSSTRKASSASASEARSAPRGPS